VERLRASLMISVPGGKGSGQRPGALHLDRPGAQNLAPSEALISEPLRWLDRDPTPTGEGRAEYRRTGSQPALGGMAERLDIRIEPEGRVRGVNIMSSSTYLLAGQASELERLQLQSRLEDRGALAKLRVAACLSGDMPSTDHCPVNVSPFFRGEHFHHACLARLTRLL
jgi:hypothetical protein